MKHFQHPNVMRLVGVLRPGNDDDFQDMYAS